MLTVNKKEFESALGKCNKVIAKKPTLEILKGINVECKDGVCKLTATDLENRITIKLNNAVFDNDNSFVIMDVVVLSKAIKTFGDTITLEQKDSNVVVSSGTKSIKVRYLGSNEFPDRSLLGDFDIIAQADVNGKELESECSKVLYGVSKDMARPILTGVCFRKNYIATSDGYLIAKIDNNFIDCDVVFIANTVKLFGMVGNGKLSIGTYKVGSSDNYYLFEDETVSLYGMLIPGNFPDIDCVIPAHREYYLKYTLNRIELINALDSLIGTKARCVKVYDNKIAVQNIQGDDFPEYEIEIKNLKVETPFAFYPKFVRDALKNQFTTEKVLVEVNKPNQAFVITAIGDSGKDGLFVCIPIHLG